MYDIIVIGGGPAGMTAALYGLRNGKSVMVLEKHGFGGQITYSPRVENIPGFSVISGNEYADKFMEQIMAQGADIELEEAVSIDCRQPASDEERSVCGGRTVKVIKTAEGSSYEAQSVVLATGVRHRMLGLEGENELVGEGISFCAVCDGDFYKGKKVAIAGGGNSAFVEAVLLAEKCGEVVMLQDLPDFTADKKLQNDFFAHDNVSFRTNTKILELLTEDGKFLGVHITNTATGEDEYIDCDGLFVAIGLIPENEAFKDLADLNSFGYFDTDESCKTRTPGVFVAGDCRSKTVRQVTTACADGAIAALAACEYLR